jgi:SecD/SecF fusion protein
VALTPHCLETLQTSWSVVSGQMSDSMRNNALLGLLLSFVAIFIYITFRFEFKFATSAIVCLFHDVLLTIATMSVLHVFGVPLQIDMHTIAALMTIIGYSLNDTIIIFDRIREDVKLYRTDNWYDIVNRSLNTTLSRTTITSGITLIVLIILVLLGGSTIFSFAFTMTIGMIFGTLSSLYIASPLMLALHNYEEKKASKLVNNNSLS